MSFTLIAFSPGASEWSADMAARGAILSLIMIGILKCLQIARRPQTNAKGCYAMAVLLGSWVLLGGYDLSLRVMEHQADRPGVNPAVSVVVLLLAFAGVIASIVLALLANSEIKQEPGRFTQGRSQAAWAFTLSALMATAIGYGAYNRATRSTQQIAQITSNVRDVDAAVSPLSSTLPPTGTLFRNEELNFEFALPGRPWTPLDAGQTAPDAQFVFHRSDPHISLVVVAEPLGGIAISTSDDLLEIVKLNAASQGVHLEVVHTQPRTIHGLDGVQMVSRLRGGRLPLSYVHWVGARNGIAYQLTSFSNEADEELLVSNAQTMYERFRLIDPDRRSPSAGSNRFDYVSPRSGFSLTLGEPGWVEWKGIEELKVAAETWAGRADGSSIVVSVVPLRRQSPSLPAVVHGLLSLRHIDSGDRRIRRRHAVRKDGVDGVEFDCEATADGLRFRYRMQVFVKNDRAYLAMFTAPENSFDDAFVDAALSQFRLNQDAAPFDPKSCSPQQLAEHATVFNGIALYENQRGNLAACRPYLELACDLDPQSALYIENLVEVLAQQDQFAEALKVMDDRMEAMWDKGHLPSLHAALLAANDRPEEAIQEFSRLFADGYWNESEFIRFIELVWANSGAEAALDELAWTERPHRSPSLTALRGDLLVDAGRAEDAVTILETGWRDHPADSELGVSLIAAYRSSGRGQDAATLADDLTSSTEANAAVWFQKGLTEFELEHYPAAKTSLEKANQLMPGVADVEELLAVTTSMLGQGDTQSVSTPIDPVQLPEGVQLADLSLENSRSDEAGAYDNWRIRVIEFHQGHEYRETIYDSFTVLDESAVEPLQTLQFPFDPQFEQLYLNRLEVFDSDGKQVASADRHQCYVTHRQAGVEASEELTLHVPVPALRPGRRVEAVVTTRDLAEPDEFPYIDHLFASAYPTGYNVLSVRGDVDAVTWAGLPPARQTEEEIVWVQRRLPPFEYESDQESPVRFLPFVELADSQARWTTEVHEYLDAIEDRLPTPTETQELAQQIPIGSLPAYVALAEYVQSHFTYQALEFGRHSRVMAPSNVVLTNQYGDCKDLSLLLWQLLKEHGVEAHLALVHSGGELTPELETIDQCDHMVVYLPNVAGGHVLDPTNRWGDPRLPVTKSLSGSFAVILDADDPRVVQLPSCPEDEFQRSVAVTARFAADGSARTEQTLQFEGDLSTSLRALLGSRSIRERENVVRQYLAISHPDVQIQNVEIENQNDVELPLVIRLTGEVREALHDADGRYVGRIPFLSQMHQLTVDDEPLRRTPFAFRDPMLRKVSVRLVPPAGWVIHARSDEPTEGDNEFVGWSLHERQEDNQLVFESEVLRHAGRFPASRRSDYRDAVNDASSAVSPRIELLPIATQSAQTTNVAPRR